MQRTVILAGLSVLVVFATLALFGVRRKTAAPRVAMAPKAAVSVQRVAHYKMPMRAWPRGAPVAEAHASFLSPPPCLDGLVRASSHIVIGEPEAILRTGRQRFLDTLFEVKVERYLRGSGPGVLKVLCLGGLDGSGTVRVYPGVPLLPLNERCLLFLSDENDKRSLSVGFRACVLDGQLVYHGDLDEVFPLRPQRCVYSLAGGIVGPPNDGFQQIPHWTFDCVGMPEIMDKPEDEAVAIIQGIIESGKPGEGGQNS